MAALLTLALAIGASVAVFAVADQVLFRSLSIDDPGRVVVIWPREKSRPTTTGEISYPEFQRWRQELAGLDHLTAIGSTNWSLVLREGEPATLAVAAVSSSFFPLLGTPALAGRTLQPDDDRRGAGRVLVLSYGTWQTRFGGDPTIVGRALRFDDTTYTVVGILPSDFGYPSGAEAWVALTPQLADAVEDLGADPLTEPIGVLFVLGRLQPGVTLEAVRSRATELMANNPAAFRPDMEAIFTPLDRHIFGSMRPALLSVIACAGFVLCIGCANVATLLLVRAMAKSHEMATRVALGATRWRLFRQALTEASVLTLSGAAVGLLLAMAAIRVLVALAPIAIARLTVVHLDGRSLLFALGISLAAAGVIGALVATPVFGWNIAQALNRGGLRLVGARGARRLLVASQVTLAVVLLVSTGLVVRSFRGLLQIDIGFNPTRILTIDLSLPEATDEAHTAFVDEMLERIRGMAGVESAGAIFLRPFEHSGIGMDAPIVLEGERPEPEFRAWDRHPLVNLETVTPDYFRTMSLSLVAGRGFTNADRFETARVVVVSEGLARQLWPGESPLDKRLLPPGMGSDAKGQPRWATVVGVVRDARYRGLTDPRFDLYAPYRQLPGMPVQHLMVRVSGDPLALVAPIRREARRLNDRVLVENAALMEGLVADATAPWRFTAWVLGALSLLAVCLSALGIYALASQSAAERRREIGLRIALGARPRQLVAMMLRDELKIALAGLVLGLLISTWTSRVVESLLYGVRSVDPLTLISAAALIAAASVAAVIGPTWRAAHAEPSTVLREL